VRLAILLLCACGRIDFGVQGGVGNDSRPSDGESSDAIAACASWSSWSAPQRNVELASVDNDWETALTADGQTLVYTRQSTTRADLYLSTRQGAAWSTPAAIAGLIPGNEFGAAWNLAGTRLYFASFGPTRQLYVSNYAQGVFDQAVLVAGLESTASITSPTLSTDELEMFYTQDVNVSAADIGRAVRSSTADAWTDLGPVPELNTSAVVGWPSLSADGLSIYIENDVPDGEIYVATRAAIGAPFGAAVPVTEIDAIPTNGDPEISRDGTTLIFDSDRAGGAGLNDVYTVTRTCM
jgi:Tol biopolymer transport system component